MHETKQQVTARKIRNGLRKQAEKVWAEKMEVWNELKRDPNEPKWGIVRMPRRGIAVLNLETTA